MDYNPCIDAIGNPAVVGLNSFVEQYDGRIVLLQFTGLLDKNGKEIYEGDILKCITKKKYRENGGNLLVHFNEESAFVVSETLPITWGGFKSVEIIGNVYENSELLEAND